jgi:hypothetical protein
MRMESSSMAMGIFQSYNIVVRAMKISDAYGPTRTDGVHPSSAAASIKAS